MSIVTFLKDLTENQVSEIVSGGVQRENISYDAIYDSCFVNIISPDMIALERPFSSSVTDYITQCNQIIAKHAVKNYSGDVEEWLIS